MRDIADATGGTAFYNNNGLDKIAAHWLDNGGSFYTLTYSPKDFRFDNKWHTVKVKLSAEFSGYTLSYRRGYFADATTAARQKEQKPRTLLRSNGDTLTAPGQRSVPIIFQVHVAPASQEPASSSGAAATSNLKAPKREPLPIPSTTRSPQPTSRSRPFTANQRLKSESRCSPSMTQDPPKHASQTSSPSP